METRHTVIHALASTTAGVTLAGVLNDPRIAPILSLLVAIAIAAGNRFLRRINPAEPPIVVTLPSSCETCPHRANKGNGNANG